MKIYWGTKEALTAYCWWFDKGLVVVGSHPFSGMHDWMKQGCSNHHSFTTREELISDLQRWLDGVTKIGHKEKMINSFREAITKAQEI